MKHPMPERVTPARKFYGAVESSTNQLYLIVEAGDWQEAQGRYRWLAPLFGVMSGGDVQFLEVQDYPACIPVFLDAFFSGEEVDAADVFVAPSTTRRQ